MAKKGPARRVVGGTYKVAKRAGRSTLRGGNLHNARASAKAGHGFFGRAPKKASTGRSPSTSYSSDPYMYASSSVDAPRDSSTTLAESQASPQSKVPHEPTVGRPIDPKATSSFRPGWGTLILMIALLGWWLYAHRQVDEASFGPEPPALREGQRCARSGGDPASSAAVGISNGSVVAEIGLRDLITRQQDEVEVRIGLNGASQMFGERDPGGSDDDVVAEITIVPRHEVLVHVARPEGGTSPDVGAVANFKTGELRVSLPHELLTDTSGYEWGVAVRGGGLPSRCSQTGSLVDAA